MAEPSDGMFRNLLVGVDEHQGGRDAIALATQLAAPGRVLTLAHVYAGEAHERERLHELLESVRAEAGVDAALRLRQSPYVGRGLHELCELINPDVLVVGSSRRGFLGRVFMGDDTRGALNGAPCPIAVAPADYAKEPVAMREIGVGYDGSPESEHAIAVARRIAAARGARLSAFSAVSVPAYAFMAGTAPVGNVPEGMVDEARSRIEALGDVESHAAYGQASEELALYSASLDLLVVGSRGYGPIGRLIHGSTSRQLLGEARCPLLILTRTARPAADHDGAGA